MSTNLTTLILIPPCHLTSALLRIDTTSFNTGSPGNPLSVFSRTRPKVTMELLNPHSLFYLSISFSLTNRKTLPFNDGFTFKRKF